ncbi:hypothetical protein AB0J47_30995 [Nocardia sp. NPDC049737]|uniref:hypothetical protein n=1 Tax=Nocardia sp. NPDC049737 TaxID=3154358 RepID=UPI003424C54E
MHKDASWKTKKVNERVTTGLIGVGLFEMNLDDGRLPVNIDVNRNLHNRLDPQDFSVAAMTGYYVALWRHDAPIIKSGNWAALSTSPSRRAELIRLLDTQSLAEFEAVERALHLRDEFVGRGPITDFGTPSVTVTASIARISDININPRWAATVDPSYLAYDIVDCANQVRQQRPPFHEDGSWAARSDEELEYELAEYKDYLMRKS